MTRPLLEVDNLKIWFSRRAGLLSHLFERERHVKAVDGVSLQLQPGEILGLAGESGCGKSSLSFAVLRHYAPREGRVLFEGRDVFSFEKKELKAFRRKVQIIFQDPYQSLNPRLTVFQSVSEPLVIHGMGDAKERRAGALAALRSAGLLPPEDFLGRYPHELSGGQRQRVAIARAIVLRPRLLVADEPVSMLDVSVRAGILNLLRGFAKEQNIAILYISHDLGTIRYLCDRVAIMYLGRIAETGRAEGVIRDPQHPYTKALIDSVPEADAEHQRRRPELLGKFIETERPHQGCRFQPRCPLRMEKCIGAEPELIQVGLGHWVSCHLHEGRHP